MVLSDQQMLIYVILKGKDKRQIFLLKFSLRGLVDVIKNISLAT